MIVENIAFLKQSMNEGITLVAVSKTKPADDILIAYNVGQRHFGENKVQELIAKYEMLPKDIQWHFIGHLQTNKVKYIVPFVHLIHSVDSFKLLEIINNEAAKSDRIVNCLLQVYIATEDTKYGLSETELFSVLQLVTSQGLPFINVRGLMGMASYTDDTELVTNEYRSLKKIFDVVQNNATFNLPNFNILSMGMSGDYKLALAEGSNMVRLGSSIFGERIYNKNPIT